MAKFFNFIEIGWFIIARIIPNQHDIITFKLVFEIGNQRMNWDWSLLPIKEYQRWKNLRIRIFLLLYYMRSNDASVNAKELLKHVGLYQYVSAVFSQHFWKDNSNSAKLHVESKWRDNFRIELNQYYFSRVELWTIIRMMAPTKAILSKSPSHGTSKKRIIACVGFWKISNKKETKKNLFEGWTP